jgi:hypothetical protein
MSQTTSYRAAAFQAEIELCWLEATHCYEQAFANYPILLARGALAQADIARMTARMDACRVMAAA